MPEQKRHAPTLKQQNQRIIWGFIRVLGAWGDSEPCAALLDAEEQLMANQEPLKTLENNSLKYFKLM